MSPPSPARDPGGVSRRAAKRYLGYTLQERVHRRHIAEVLVSAPLRLLRPHLIEPRCALAVPSLSKVLRTICILFLTSGNSPVQLFSERARARSSRGREGRQEPNEERRVRG
jgi:hypothetical protein